MADKNGMSKGREERLEKIWKGIEKNRKNREWVKGYLALGGKELPEEKEKAQPLLQERKGK